MGWQGLLPSAILKSFALVFLLSCPWYPTHAFQLPTYRHRTAHSRTSLTPAATSTPVLPSLIGLLWPALALFLGPIPTPAISPAASITTTQSLAISRGGIPELNEFIKAVKQVKDELQSEAATDLGKVQRAFDVDAVMSAVDGALESRSSQADQINAVGRRKSVDKVLRQVLNDVILVEDRLRELAPDKVALTRMKKVDGPLGKLESDLGRLTNMLTSDNTEAAGSFAKPLFALCPDGYLLCEKQD